MLFLVIFSLFTFGGITFDENLIIPFADLENITSQFETGDLNLSDQANHEE